MTVRLWSVRRSQDFDELLRCPDVNPISSAQAMRLSPSQRTLWTGWCVAACLWAGGCKRAPPAVEAVVNDVQAIEAATALPTDPLLRTQVLESGVTYLSRSYAATAPRVVLGLVVKGGALVESDDERGLAHFVEHMAFDGTAHYDSKRLRDFFGRAGMEFGSHASAFTTRTSTLYLLEVPSDDPATLDEAVLVLRDWATGVLFEPDAVERVRPVLLAEKRTDSNAQQRIGQRLTALVMQGSRHAERDVYGLESVLSSASAERLRSFYRRWYQPQNLAVLAEGDFDIRAMQRRVEQQFGGLQKAESLSTPPHFEVPVSVAEHVVVDSDPELSRSMCALTLKRKAQPVATEENYRLQLENGLLQWLLQQRLEAAARAPGAWLGQASVSIGTGEVGSYDGLHLVAEPPHDQEARAFGQLLAELERVSHHGFQSAEFERGRAVLARDWAARLKGGRRLRESALQLRQHFLTGDPVLARADEVELSERLLASISLDELNRHAASWVQQSERYHIVVGRDAAALPSEAALRAVAAETRKTPLGPLPEAGHTVPLMEASPSAGAIALRATRCRRRHLRVAPVQRSARHLQSESRKSRQDRGISVQPRWYCSGPQQRLAGAAVDGQHGLRTRARVA